MMCREKKTINFIAIVLFSVQLCGGQIVKAPASVDTRPNLLDSYIPASMQIIAHLTEQLKYDVKPQPTTPTTSTTTQRPTTPHNPGIFAPDAPPGPDVYFAKGALFEEYIEKLKKPTGHHNYFDRYNIRETRNYPSEFQTFIPDDLLKLINTIEEDFDVKNVDEQVEKFSASYDDDKLFRLELMQQKRVPPTRAYVGLLSLYDLLNKESKKLGLSKYNGYSDNLLKDLSEVSTGTSAYQLRHVLGKISERRDTKNEKILKRINEMVKDLDENSSYINAALRYIPPLPFAL